MISVNQKIDIDENYVRHLTLNVIRSARSKYYGKFGEVIICTDSIKNYWRKDIFPYYKASRKAARKESKVDWNELFRIIDLILTEITEVFPYKVLRVDHAEADDIIATICQRETGPHIIISNDKDFLQLKRISGVEIYSPKLHSKMDCQNPETFLIEHIIKGDQGDGIPNILSDDDTFVVAGKRQKVIREAKMKEWVISVPANVFDEKVLNNYNRNESLISLFRIPDDISDEIWETYQNTTPQGTRGMPMMKYFMAKNLRNLIENLKEF